MKIDELTNCPKCNMLWDGGRIWKRFREMEYYKDKTDEELQQIEKESYSPPYHFSNLVGIEVRGKYDGVSYWQCPECKSTWDRWTDEEVEKIE